MPRPEGSIDPSSPYASLATALRELRRQHALKYSELAERANYGHSVLSDAARGRHLPTWEVVLAYVKACDPELDETEQEKWHQLWTDARDRGKGNCS